MTEFLTDGANPLYPIPEDGIDSLAFLDYPDLKYADARPLFTEDELDRIGSLTEDELA